MLPVAVGAAVLGLLAACSHGGEMVPYLEVVKPFSLTVGGSELVVEVAANATSRQQGLKYRDVLPDHRGMLFVFPEEGLHSFFMKDAFVPLDIAFIDRDGVIVNIEELVPLQEMPGAVPLRKVPYALEVNQGWFEGNGVKAGDRIEWPDWLDSVVVQ